MANKNMSLEKTKMPEQAPDVRNKNFEEVALGYTAEMAVNEAQRCLNCKNMPCVSGCPVNVQIPQFISLVAEGKFEEGYQKIAETSTLPAICGRVCPQENQCEGKCVRGIKGESVAIGRLERFCADYHMEHSTEKPKKVPSNGHKVAVLGAGPASLTCASDLVQMGYDVTMLEAFHAAGGVLIYGIPEFRLPKAIVAKEVENLEAMGVNIQTNVVVGKSISIEDLKEEGYEAIFIGTGAGLPSFMGIEGENLNRQRISDPHQPDESLRRQARHPDLPRQESGRGRRRQRGDGCRPLRQAHGRRCFHRVSPRPGRAARP